MAAPQRNNYKDNVEPIRGFVASPAAAAARAQREEEERQAQARAEGFAKFLARYYEIRIEQLEALEAADKTKISPVLDTFEVLLPVPKDLNEPLHVYSPEGTQMPFVVDGRESVLLKGKAPLTIEVALEMALVAKANPDFVDGIDVAGTDDEKMILTAAAQAMGLKVLNGPEALPPMLAAEVAQKWSALKQRADLPAQQPPADEARVGDVSPMDKSVDEHARDVTEKEAAPESEQPPVMTQEPPQEETVQEETAQETADPDQPAAAADDVLTLPLISASELADKKKNDEAGDVVEQEAQQEAQQEAPQEEQPEELSEDQPEAESEQVSPAPEKASVDVDYDALTDDQKTGVGNILQNLHKAQLNEDAPVEDLSPESIKERWDNMGAGVRKNILGDLEGQQKIAADLRAYAEETTQPPVPVPEATQQFTEAQETEAPAPTAAADKTNETNEADPVDEVVDVSPADEAVEVVESKSDENLPSPPVAGFKKPSGLSKEFSDTEQELSLSDETLTEDAPQTAAEILEEGGVDPDMYALVKLRVIGDQKATRNHVENVIGFDNDLPGSKKATPVILKALEADGIVKQEYPRGPRKLLVNWKGEPYDSSEKPQDKPSPTDPAPG